MQRWRLLTSNIPTDIDLLNKSWEHLEAAVGIVWKEIPHTCHKLPYSAKKARRSYLKLARSKKWTRANCRKAIAEQPAYIELAARQLNKFATLAPAAKPFSHAGCRIALP